MDTKENKKDRATKGKTATFGKTVNNERSDEYYMSLAIKQAKVGEKKGEVPIGAVVVFGGEVIASAHNTRESKGMATGHAELLAIEKSCKVFMDWRLSRCVLYVTLEPCPMCLGAAMNARIGRIVFGARDKASGACGTCINMHEYNICNHNIVVEGGVMEEQCVELLKNYFKAMREKKKK